jgi:hypothetical protein
MRWEKKSPQRKGVRVEQGAGKQASGPVSQGRYKLEASSLRLEAQIKSGTVTQASSFELPASSRLHMSI